MLGLTKSFINRTKIAFFRQRTKREEKIRRRRPQFAAKSRRRLRLRYSAPAKPNKFGSALGFSYLCIDEKTNQSSGYEKLPVLARRAVLRALHRPGIGCRKTRTELRRRRNAHAREQASCDEATLPPRRGGRLSRSVEDRAALLHLFDRRGRGLPHRQPHDLRPLDDDRPQTQYPHDGGSRRREWTSTSSATASGSSPASPSRSGSRSQGHPRRAHGRHREGVPALPAAVRRGENARNRRRRPAPASKPPPILSATGSW